MANPIIKNEKTDTVPFNVYTVSNIVAPQKGEDFYTITFNESARFYQLYRKNKNLLKILKLLNASRKKQEPVQVWVTMNLGSVIDNVQPYKKK